MVRVRVDKLLELSQRLEALGVRESELIERFVRASGHGGQKVNKTSVAVYLKHIPTGIEVKVQSSRSQAANRFFARRRLAERLESEMEENRKKERQRVEKIRRQKRKRSKRAKEKMLADKHAHSEKKERRRPILER